MKPTGFTQLLWLPLAPKAPAVAFVVVFFGCEFQFSLASLFSHKRFCGGLLVPQRFFLYALFLFGMLFSPMAFVSKGFLGF